MLSPVGFSDGYHDSMNFKLIIMHILPHVDAFTIHFRESVKSKENMEVMDRMFCLMGRMDKQRHAQKAMPLINIPMRLHAFALLALDSNRRLWPIPPNGTVTKRHDVIKTYHQPSSISKGNEKLGLCKLWEGEWCNCSLNWTEAAQWADFGELDGCLQNNAWKPSLFTKWKEKWWINSQNYNGTCIDHILVIWHLQIFELFNVPCKGDEHQHA